MSITYQDFSDLSEIEDSELQGQCENHGLSTFVVAFIGEEPAAVFALDNNPHNQHAVLYRIWVKMKYRRQGIARDILRFSEEWAKDRNLIALQGTPRPLGDSIPRPSLIAFYEAAGYDRVDGAQEVWRKSF